MLLKLKYPQRFKKQHKSRTNVINTKRWLKLSSKDSHTLLTSTKKLTTPTSNLYKVYSPQRFILPKKLISFIRKFFRKFFKRHKVCCWFRIQPNCAISSKSKNSRMGRGVGSINRTAFLLKAHHPLVIFSNISPNRLKHLTNMLTKRMPIKLLTSVELL